MLLGSCEAGVGFYEKKKDETVARKQRQLSNKIEKFMNEVNSENFFGAPLPRITNSPHHQLGLYLCDMDGLYLDTNITSNCLNMFPENFMKAVTLFFKIPQILFQNISKNVLNINKLGCFLIVPKITRCNLQYS